MSFPYTWTHEKYFTKKLIFFSIEISFKKFYSKKKTILLQTIRLFSYWTNNLCTFEHFSFSFQFKIIWHTISLAYEIHFLQLHFPFHSIHMYILKLQFTQNAFHSQKIFNFLFCMCVCLAASRLVVGGVKWSVQTTQRYRVNTPLHPNTKIWI